jgi:hypothetical protein
MRRATLKIAAKMAKLRILPAKSQTERHKLLRGSSFAASYDGQRDVRLSWHQLWRGRRRWRRHIRGRKLDAIDQCPL